MKAALQHCNLNANRISATHAQKAFKKFAGNQLRLTHFQGDRKHQSRSSSSIADSLTACCSLKPSAKVRDTSRDKAGILRRAVLGGILLSAGAMPFTPKRFSSASAADLTADKV